MKLIYTSLLISLTMSRCSIFEEGSEKIRALNKYSGIEFNDSTLQVIKFSKLSSGIFNKEVSINAIYAFKANLDTSLLKNQLINLGYKKLPMDTKDGILHDGFNEYFNKKDIGLYKIKVNYTKGTQEWIIMNFTKKKIILEVNL
jgi:hypothetical protein